MRTITLIALLLSSFVVGAQTNQPLPSGSVPISNTLYLAPDSTVWTGDEFSGLFVRLGKWQELTQLNSKVDSVIITPNMFANIGMNDTEKIQASLNLAIALGKPLFIQNNIERGENLWLLDSAVLLSSGSNIVIDGTKIKISDQMRDNVFRSTNVGLGKTAPGANPIKGVSITGRGEATIEGADNPRSTGDSGKDLSTSTTQAVYQISYGTDYGVSGQRQKADWRNIGILLGFTDDVVITGLKMIRMHGWAMSLERCKNIFIRDIYFEQEANRIYNGSTQWARNCDGINIRMGGESIMIENVRGRTGDDAVAFTVLDLDDDNVGTYDAYSVTGDSYNPATDNIYTAVIRDALVDCYHNIVRLLNVKESEIYDVTIDNVVDASTTDTEVTNTSCVLLGDNNPVYGGATPMGNLRNITINNIRSYHKTYTIRVLGSIAESTITNVYKKYTGGFNQTYTPVYFDPNSLGSRNLTVSNIVHDGGIKDLLALREGKTAKKTGFLSDLNGNFLFIDSLGRGIRNAGVYTPGDSTLITKGYADGRYRPITAAAGGVLSISGGPTATIQSIGRTGYGGAFASFPLTTGLFPYVVTGATGYPNSAGAGIRLNRDGSTAVGAFDIFVSQVNDGKLRLNLGTTGTSWKGYETFATEEYLATSSQIIQASAFRLSALNTPPSSSTATGVANTILFGSDGRIYICTATNTWIRSEPLTTW